MTSNRISRRRCVTTHRCTRFSGWHSSHIRQRFVCLLVTEKPWEKFSFLVLIRIDKTSRSTISSHESEEKGRSEPSIHDFTGVLLTFPPSSLDLSSFPPPSDDAVEEKRRRIVATCCAIATTLRDSFLGDFFFLLSSHPFLSFFPAIKTRFDLQSLLLPMASCCRFNASNTLEALVELSTLRAPFCV
jgi:hypothetical protein